MKFKDGKICYENEAKKAEVDATVKQKLQMPVEAFYEDAGKHRLGTAFTVTHRVCMMIDFKQQQVMYKDSYGQPIPSTLSTMIADSLSIPKANITSDDQKQQHVEDHSNCAFFSLQNILCFKNNEAMISPALQNYIPVVQELRKKFAEVVRPEIEKTIADRGRYDANGELVKPNAGPSTGVASNKK